MIFLFVYEKERRQNFPHLVLQVVVSSLFFRNCAAEMPYPFWNLRTEDSPTESL